MICGKMAGSSIGHLSCLKLKLLEAYILQDRSDPGAKWVSPEYTQDGHATSIHTWVHTYAHTDMLMNVPIHLQIHSRESTVNTELEWSQAVGHRTRLSLTQELFYVL